MASDSHTLGTTSILTRNATHFLPMFGLVQFISLSRTQHGLRDLRSLTTGSETEPSVLRDSGVLYLHLNATEGCVQFSSMNQVASISP